MNASRVYERAGSPSEPKLNDVSDRRSSNAAASGWSGRYASAATARAMSATIAPVSSQRLGCQRAAGRGTSATLRATTTTSAPPARLTDHSSLGLTSAIATATATGQMRMSQSSVQSRTQRRVAHASNQHANAVFVA